MKNLELQVRQYITDKRLVVPGDVVLVGVSGGADSICLCRILAALSTELGFALRVIHVEHGIRGEESRGDAAFVEKFCSRLGIPCRVVPVSVPQYRREHAVGEEEAARILRYEAFARTAEVLKERGPVKIALAHHMEDDAETVLLALVRGARLDGMSGIRPLRVDEKGGCYIRPLLEHSRREIEAYLEEIGQSYRTDGTNGDTAYARNRLRLEIIPELETINARACEHIHDTARYLGQLRGYVDLQVEDAYRTVVDVRGRLLIERLQQQAEFIQASVIYRWITETVGVKKDIASVHVEQVRNLCDRQSGRRVELPYGAVVFREYDTLCIQKTDATHEETDQEVPLTVTEEMLEALAERGGELELAFREQRLILRIFPYAGEKAEISSKMYTKWFDYDMMKCGFVIRGRRSGDYITLGDGYRKKLKKYYVDEKIPQNQRESIPLLAQESEILWIVGRRMGYRAQIKDTTREVLEVVYQGGN